MSKIKSFREPYKEFYHFHTEIVYIIALMLMLFIATIAALSVVIHEQNAKIDFLQYTLDNVPYYSVNERSNNIKISPFRTLKNGKRVVFDSHR